MIPAMLPNRRRAVRGRHTASEAHACWIVVAGCAALAVGAPPAAAQAPTASREELMRQWDVNRDGTVDASEAEIARRRMRRARSETMMNSGTDPVTGRPRVPNDPVTGRPVPSPTAPADRGPLASTADDEGLILVPGNGEMPGKTGGATVGRETPRPPRREVEGLPGTRAPAMSSTIPSVSPRLPGAGPQQQMGARDPRSLRPGQEQSPAGARPGIIAGGVRPGARPGFGAAAPTGDLNAGRLPGGLPQTRGIAPGTVAGPRVGSMEQPNAAAGRMAGPVPSVPRPGIGPSRGATSPGVPSVGAPSVPQPGMRPPDGGRPVSRAPNTVPRVPRMTTDEFYGR